MKLFITTVLLFISLHCQAQAADSLKRLLPAARSDTSRIALYLQIAAAAEDSTALPYHDSARYLVQALLPKAGNELKLALYNYLSEAYYLRSIYYAAILEAYDSAIVYLHKALQPALAARNRMQEAKILNDLGVSAFYKNDMAATIEYQKKSLAIREELKDEGELRNAYNNMAFVYKETGMIDSSLYLNFKALALAEKSKQKEDISTSLNNIAEVYHKYLLDYPKALSYYNKSRDIRRQTGNKKDLGLINNNIASLYSDMKDYKTAIRFYRESLALRREIKSKYGIAQTLSNLAANYLKIKQYDSAKKALAESMLVNASLNDKYVEEGIRYTYAELYDALNKTDSAIYHAQKSHAINLEFGNPLDISLSAGMLSRLYEKEHNYQASLRFYKLYKTMQDSILNDKIKKEGVKRELEYQYLKKQTALDEIHRQQIAQQQLRTALLVSFFVGAAIILFILWNRYRLKQQLKEVQLRNKIASDLHDDVGSTLSSIRMYSDLVSHQIKETHPASKELLSKISSNSREMIENMSDIVWMIKPSNDGLESIEDRMLNFGIEICAPAGIGFELTKDANTAEIKMPMEQRRDIYLIFKESVNNAVKYARCKNIVAAITTTQHHLQIKVIDDGKGFDKTNIKKGNGLLNMQMRAAAHRGSVSIESSYAGGTIVTLLVPTK